MFQTHMVTFGPDGKILQIRQSWDQGALLKQVDVIGKSGRNWPIRDSQDQIKMIAKCAASVSEAAPSQNGAARGTPPRNGSFSLFGSRDENHQSIASVVSPKGGPRPAQRGFTDILGDDPSGEHAAPVATPKAGAGKNYRASRIFDADEDQPSTDDGGSPSSGRGRNESPSKVIAPKAGGAKKFTPNRLFDKDGEAIEEDVASVSVRSQSPGSVIAPKGGAGKKFGASRIFDTDERDPDEPRTTMSTGQAKPQHQSQWSFGDYATPEKAVPARTLQRPAPVDEEGSASDATALGNVTNLKDRNQTFNSQFKMTDSPGTPQAKAPLGEDRKKAVKMMDSNWEAYDVSPAPKENRPVEAKPKGGGERGIHIGGDGMGGSKGTRRDWLFGGDDAETPPRAKKTTAKSGGFSWDF